MRFRPTSLATVPARGLRAADQIVLVAGGASGLGAAVARHCAGRGAKVAILDIDDEGSGLAEELGGLFVRADITREADVNSALDQIEAHFGIARVLVKLCRYYSLCPHAAPGRTA